MESFDIICLDSKKKLTQEFGKCFNKYSLLKYANPTTEHNKYTDKLFNNHRCERACVAPIDLVCRMFCRIHGICVASSYGLV